MPMTIDPSAGAMSARSSFDETRQRSQALHGAAARYLGMTPQALRSQLDAGKSLAEIAAAQGKSVDGLKNVILGALTEGGPPGGDPQALVDRIVNAHHGQDPAEPFKHPPVEAPQIGRPPDPVESTIADYLGLSADQVRQRLGEGQTLLEIAAAQGKSPKGLKQTLLTAIQGTGGYAERGGGGYAEREQMDALLDRLMNSRGAGRSISTIA